MQGTATISPKDGALERRSRRASTTRGRAQLLESSIAHGKNREYEHRSHRFGFSRRRWRLPLRLSVHLPTLFCPSLSASAAAAAALRIRRPSSVAVRSGEDADLRIPDEWGDKSEPEAELPSVPDPPIDEDEWGAEPGLAKAREVGITDKDDDEWGAEAGFLSWNGSLVPEDDKLGDFKWCVVDSLYGKELGLKATLEDRAEILELVNQLEVANPIKAPTEAPDLLDGNWILLYTAFSELLPLLAAGATPFLKVKRISRVIDSKTLEVVNATTLSRPFATFSFSATASFEVQTSSRIQVQFKEGIFQVPTSRAIIIAGPTRNSRCIRPED